MPTATSGNPQIDLDATSKSLKKQAFSGDRVANSTGRRSPTDLPSPQWPVTASKKIVGIHPLEETGESCIGKPHRRG
jgi:hypothetical protein